MDAGDLKALAKIYREKFAKPACRPPFWQTFQNQ